MKVLEYLISLFILLSFVSCKPDSTSDIATPKKSAPSPEVEKEIDDRLYQEMADGIKQEAALDVPAMRAQALSILNYRLKNNDKTYAAIEAGVWEYKFVFDGKMSSPGTYNGFWIDFKADHTYDYGKASEVLGQGRYNYHFDREQLLMVDNVDGKKPQEFDVKFGGDAIVLVGTTMYDDRHMQMKLEKTTDDFRK